MVLEAIERYREQGERSYHEGDFEQATAAFERALAIEPGESGVQVGGGDALAALWSAKGACLARLGRYEEAAACHERAARIGPGDASRWSRLGEVHLETKHYQKAIEAFDLALAVDAECPSALLGMARALSTVGRWREAVEVARKFSAAAGRPAPVRGGAILCHE